MKYSEAMRKGFENTQHASEVFYEKHGEVIYVCPNGAVVIGVLGLEKGEELLKSSLESENDNKFIRLKLREIFPEVETVLDLTDIPEIKEYDKLIDKQVEKSGQNGITIPRERYYTLFHATLILVDFFGYDREKIVKLVEAKGF